MCYGNYSVPYYKTKTSLLDILLLFSKTIYTMDVYYIWSVTLTAYNDYYGFSSADDTWHKMAVSEGVSQGYFRLGIFASVCVMVWKCCQHIFILGSHFKLQRKTLTSSCSATAVGNRSSRRAKVLGMANLHLSELWSEIMALHEMLINTLYFR